MSNMLNQVMNYAGSALSGQYGNNNGFGSQNLMNGYSQYATDQQNNLSAAQMMQTTQQNTENSELAMQQSELKHENDLWKMVQDTQTAIYQQTQSTIQNRAKTNTKVFQKWGSTIAGGGGD